MKQDKTKILIVGGSGILGRSLIRGLVLNQLYVRVLTRSPEKLWEFSANAEIIKGSVEDEEILKNSLEGISIIYFLTNALGESAESLMELEANQARLLGKLVSKGQKIVYLCSLEKEINSPYNKSRQEITKIFLDSPGTIYQFGASLIIGEGVPLFDASNALVQRLPFIFSGRLLKFAIQPILLSDLIDQMVNLVSQKSDEKRINVIQVGGKDHIFYDDFLKILAQKKKLIRPQIDLINLNNQQLTTLVKMILPEYFETIMSFYHGGFNPSMIDDQGLEKNRIEVGSSIEEMIEKAISTTKNLDDNVQFNILKKIKDHRQISNLIKGADFLEVFDFPSMKEKGIDLALMVDRIRAPLKVISGGVRLIGWDLQYGDHRLSAHFNFFLTGEFRLQLFYLEENPDTLRLIISFRPKYFFESTQWLVYSKIIKMIYQQITTRLYHESGRN